MRDEIMRSVRAQALLIFLFAAVLVGAIIAAGKGHPWLALFGGFVAGLAPPLIALGAFVMWEDLKQDHQMAEKWAKEHPGRPWTGRWEE
jgi:hypothetical protein